MVQSPKMKIPAGQIKADSKAKPVYIDDQAYEFFCSLLTHPDPRHTDSHPTLAAWAILDEVKRKLDHAHSGS